VLFIVLLDKHCFISDGSVTQGEVAGDFRCIVEIVESWHNSSVHCIEISIMDHGRDMLIRRAMLQNIPEKFDADSETNFCTKRGRFG